MDKNSYNLFIIIIIFKLQYFNIKLNLNRYKAYQDLTMIGVQLIQLLEGALSCFELHGDVINIAERVNCES